ACANWPLLHRSSRSPCPAGSDRKCTGETAWPLRGWQRPLCVLRDELRSDLSAHEESRWCLLPWAHSPALAESGAPERDPSQCTSYIHSRLWRQSRATHLEQALVSACWTRPSNLPRLQLQPECAIH